MTVVLERRDSISIEQIWRTMIGEGLYEKYANDVDYKEKQKGDFIDKTKGAIRVAFSKEDLKRGYHRIVRSFGGLYHYDCNTSFGLSHWTPNIYLDGLNATEDNLRAVRVFGFDIDQKMDSSKIEEAFEELGLPCRPVLMLDTPRGIQFFVVLSQAFRGSRRAINAAKCVGLALKEKLSTILPIDMQASSTGWFRFPRIDTVLYYAPNNLWKTEGAVAWLKNNPINKASGRFKTSDKWLNTSAGQKLIRSNSAKGERNERAFAIALMCYHDNLAQDVAMDILDQWNSNLTHPLVWREITRTVESAYTGRYGICLDLIEQFVGERPQIFKKWYKFKKDRKDRVYSHLNETEADVYSYVSKNTTDKNPWIATSCRHLATHASKEKELKKSAIQQLKRSKKFVIREKKNAVGQILKGKLAGFFIMTKEQYKRWNKRIFKKFIVGQAEIIEEGLMSKLPIFRYRSAFLSFGVLDSS